MIPVAIAIIIAACALFACAHEVNELRKEVQRLVEIYTSVNDAWKIGYGSVEEIEPLIQPGRFNAGRQQ